MISYKRHRLCSLLISASALFAGGGHAFGSEQIECPPVGLGAEHLSNDTYQAILDEYVELGFPGVTAAIYTPSEGLWVGASGFSDRENEMPMATCNVLFSGSVAKMYTVASALFLNERGVFRLRDPIAPYLSEELQHNLPNAKKATIKQLMNHTAGMPDHDDEEGLEAFVLENEGRLPPAEDQLAFLFDNEPLFEPGELPSYSSAHTLTLSLVMDDAINGNHADVVSSAIIDKLGLRETFYKNEPGYPSPENLVRGYLGTGEEAFDITDFAVNYADGSQGDAGIIASAHDYYLFMRGLVEGEILRPRTLKRAVKKGRYLFDDGNVAFGFGLGVFLIKKDGELVKVGHSGTTLGGMSHVYYYPTRDAYVVLLTNTLVEDDDPAFELWGQETLVGTGIKSITADFETLIFAGN